MYIYNIGRNPAASRDLFVCVRLLQTSVAKCKIESGILAEDTMMIRSTLCATELCHHALVQLRRLSDLRAQYLQNL